MRKSMFMRTIASAATVIALATGAASSTTATTSATAQASVKTSFPSADPGLSLNTAEPRASRSEYRLPLYQLAASSVVYVGQAAARYSDSAATKRAAQAAAHKAAVKYARHKAAAHRKAVAAKKRAAKLAYQKYLQTHPKAFASNYMSQKYGWGEAQFTCLNDLWNRESSWLVHEQTGSAYGIPQSLPGRKMASFGSDWRYNAQTQIKWGLWYIADRYHSPCAAWDHSNRYNYY